MSPSATRSSSTPSSGASSPSVQKAIAGDRHWQAALAREDRDAGDWCREHGLL